MPQVEPAPDWSVEQTRKLLRYAERDGFLRAKLRLMTQSDSGRRHPIYSGWVTGWNLGGDRDGQRPDTDAAIVINDGKLHPGDAAEVQIFPIGFAWRDVGPQHRIELLDGRRVVGVGVVTEEVEGTQNLPGRWPCYSAVRLRDGVEGAQAGSVGTILQVYEDAYEVEIEDGDGQTLYLAAIADDHLELLDRHGF